MLTRSLVRVRKQYIEKRLKVHKIKKRELSRQ